MASASGQIQTRYSLLLRKRRDRILITGVIILEAGMVFLLSSVYAVAMPLSVVGLLLFSTGLLQLCAAYQIRERVSLPAWTLLTAFYLAFGLFSLTEPIGQFELLALIFTIGMLGAGFMRIACGLNLRSNSGSDWLVAGGAGTVMIAGHLIVRWPNVELEMAAALISLDLILYGASLVAFALQLGARDRSRD
jgi:uncharacterized membrane protein HdeD (DUF308 family)